MYAGRFAGTTAMRTLDGIRDLAKTPAGLFEVRQAQVRNQADLRLQIAQGKIDYTAGVEYRRQQAPTGMGNSLGFFFSAPLPVFNRNQGEIVRAQREIGPGRRRRSARWRRGSTLKF